MCFNPGTSNTVHWTKSEQSDAKTVNFYFLQQKFIKTKFLKKQGIIIETHKVEKIEDLIQRVKIREKSDFGKNWTCIMKFQNSKKSKSFQIQLNTEKVVWNTKIIGQNSKIHRKS